MKRFATAWTLAACTFFSVGNAVAMDELHKKYSCSACHADDKKLVGPSYKEVAAKYKGDKVLNHYKTPLRSNLVQHLCARRLLVLEVQSKFDQTLKLILGKAYKWWLIGLNSTVILRR